MKHTKIIFFIFALFMLVASSFAAQTQTAKTLTADQTKAIEQGKELLKVARETLGDSDPIGTIYLLYNAKATKEFCEQQGITADISGVKERDDELLGIIMKLVAKHKLADANLKDLTAELNRQLKESGDTLVVEDGDIDIYIYEDPILYTVGFFTSFVAYATTSVAKAVYVILGIFLLLNLIRMVFDKNSRNIKSLFGAGLFSSLKKTGKLLLGSIPFVNKLKENSAAADEESARIVALMTEKETLIKENKNKMDKLLLMVRDKYGKVDPGKLWADEVREFERSWNEEVLQRLAPINEALSRHATKYINHLDLIEGGFTKRFLEKIKEDSEAIKRIEKKNLLNPNPLSVVGGVKTIDIIESPARELTRNLETIRNMLLDEAKIILHDLRPDENKLANLLRELQMIIDIEAKLIDTEKHCLLTLNSQNIHGNKLKETLDLLTSTGEEKVKAFTKEKEVVAEMERLKEKLKISEEKIEEDKLQEMRTLTITKEMLENRKYNPHKKAHSQLQIKEGHGAPTVDEIWTVSDLKIKLVPRSISMHQSVALSDESAFYLFRKTSSERPDIVLWLESECDNPELARIVGQIIEDYKLPEEINYNVQQVMQRGRPGVISTPVLRADLVNKLNKIRKQIVLAIGDAYPPLK